MIRTCANPTDRWLPTVRPWSQGTLRLFCIPYAGGGASAFRDWVGALGESIEICPVQLPGREARFREPPFTRLGPLVEALVEAIVPHLDRPFALFGHSLGALIAFELTRRLRLKARPAPVYLFVSGCRAPQVRRADRCIHTLPDSAFRQELRRLGGTPAEVLGNEELMELVLPTLRADFGLCETYEYTDGYPLPCPITALGGRDDETICREDLEAWCMQTNARFACYVLPGDHFFVRTARERLMAEFSRALGHAACSSHADRRATSWSVAQAEYAPVV